MAFHILLGALTALAVLAAPKDGGKPLDGDEVNPVTGHPTITPDFEKDLTQLSTAALTQELTGVGPSTTRTRRSGT